MSSIRSPCYVRNETARAQTILGASLLRNCARAVSLRTPLTLRRSGRQRGLLGAQARNYRRSRGAVEQERRRRITGITSHQRDLMGRNLRGFAAILAAASAAACPLNGQPVPGPAAVRVPAYVDGEMPSPVSSPAGRHAHRVGSPIAALNVSERLELRLAPALLADAADTGVRVVLGALVGGAAGMLIGGYSGFRLEESLSDPCREMCGLGGMILGSFLGGSIGMSAGAHMANGRAGNLPGGIGATIGVGAGSAFIAGGLMSQMEAGSAVLFVFVPAIQVYTAVTVERNTGRRRSSR
jgi:hypothetical protein